MKKEVVLKPRDKDFLEFIKEKVDTETKSNFWIYIDQLTVEYLREIKGVSYMDTYCKLHIPYGNIVVEGYNIDNSWYRIHSINSEQICFDVVADPDEFLFITIEV